MSNTTTDNIVISSDIDTKRFVNDDRLDYNANNNNGNSKIVLKPKTTLDDPCYCITHMI